MILLRLISWPYFRKHVLRTILTVAGIVLGVAVFVGMHTANQSVLFAFSRTVDRIAGRTEIQVTAGEAGFAEDILEKVQSAASVRVAVPVIEAVVDTNIAGEGHLLVLGFRPFSLWGFRSRAISRGYPPGLKRMLGMRRIADWLELLGYDVGLSRNYLFTPPWGGSAPRPGIPSALLRRGWLKPWPAGAYLLKARKRIYTLTPIRPRVRERVQAIGGLAKPTTPRQSS